MSTPDAAPLGDAPVLPPADEAPESRERKRRSKGAAGSREPRKPRERAEARPARSPRTATTRQAMERGVANTVHSIAFAVSMLDPVDGAIIANGSDDLVAAVMATADQNPGFKRWLDDALKGGTYLQLVAAVGAIAIPIAARHLPLPPAFAFAASRPKPDRAPDTIPTEWNPPSSTHEPGVIYEDEAGPYTVDAAGNVVPVGSNGDAAAL